MIVALRAMLTATSFFEFFIVVGRGEFLREG